MTLNITNFCFRKAWEGGGGGGGGGGGERERGVGNIKPSRTPTRFGVTWATCLLYKNGHGRFRRHLSERRKTRRALGGLCTSSQDGGGVRPRSPVRSAEVTRRPEVLRSRLTCAGDTSDETVTGGGGVDRMSPAPLRL